MSEHSYTQTPGSRRMGWAVILNILFTIIEFVGGWLTNSTAIMADAIHDLGDSVSMGIAWFLEKLSGQGSSERYSYGYRRFSLLGALINGVVLLAGAAFMLFETIPRLYHPQMPMVSGMFWLALLGVGVNGVAAYQLRAGKTLNERLVNWHLLEDVLGWVAILTVSVALMFVDWPILDPLLSIGFTLFILFNVFKNVYLTMQLFLQATPDKVLPTKISEAMLKLQSVKDIHHLHLWSLDGEHHVLTAHLVVDVNDISSQKKLKEQIALVLKDFKLAHTTIELELQEESCRDDKHRG